MHRSGRVVATTVLVLSAVVPGPSLAVARSPEPPGVSDPSAAPIPFGSPSPALGPGSPETALCEDDEAATLKSGGTGSLIASLDGADVSTLQTQVLTQLDGLPPGSAGCRAPVKPHKDPFADGTLDLFTIGDPAGDGPLDILRTSWGDVGLTRAEARALDRDEKVVVVGKRSDVLKKGAFHAVCVELAADPIAGDTIHIATDVGEDPFRRIPSAVTGPTGELANVRDIATLVVEEGGARLFSSDLSTGEWYMGKGRYGAVLDGRDACFLFPADQLGADFRPVTYRPGDAGGYDTGGLGAAPGLLSTSGTFGWIPDCIEQLLIHEPLVLEDVEVSYSTDWVTFCFSASESDLEEIVDFVDDVDKGDHVARGLIRFRLREDGQDNDQERPLDVWIEGDRIYMSFPIGLKAYGFHALDDVEILPTGDDLWDEILDEAAVAIARRMNPTTFDATPGRMQGDRECAARPGSIR